MQIRASDTASATQRRRSSDQVLSRQFATITAPLARLTWVASSPLTPAGTGANSVADAVISSHAGGGVIAAITSLTNASRSAGSSSARQSFILSSGPVAR